MIQAALVVTALACLLLGFFVYVSNPRGRLFQIFFILTIVSSAWIIVNDLTITKSITNNYALDLRINQLITPLSLIAFYAFYLFLRIFKTHKLNNKDIIAFIPNFMVGLFSFSHFNVYLNSSHSATLGTLYPFYIVALLIDLFLILQTLYSNQISEHHDVHLELQLNYLKIGTLATFIPILIFGVLFPVINLNTLSDLAPIFTIVFLGFSAAAIVKQRLFDIRFFAVRASAYILSFLLLSILYLTPLVLLVGLIMQTHFTWLRFVAGILIVLLLAIFYGRIHEIFNRFTSKLFMRGYYEPQEILNELSELLVRTIDLAQLEKNSSGILKNTFQTRDCEYWLVADHPQQIENIINKLFHDHHSSNIVILDDLDDKSLVIEELQNENLAVIVRLRTSHTNLGFIALGYKESGEFYTRKDKQLLRIAADEIAISLQNALRFQEIKNFNITLQEKIHEATGKLRIANDQLKELDNAKDDFISMASHQLRTPLTVIKGYINMVMMGDAGKINDQEKNFLSQAMSNTERMANFVTDLLSVSRITSGKFTIENTPVNLADIVDNEVKQLKNMADYRKLALNFTKPEHFPALMLDEEKTKQVVGNFLDNAIHYSKTEGGKIDVYLTNENDIEFKVVDNGIGVPDKEKEHLFTKYYRAPNAKKARPDGTGVGLYLAKTVIDGEGGELIFESKEGEGSTFGFSFKKDKIVTTPSHKK